MRATLLFFTLVLTLLATLTLVTAQTATKPFDTQPSFSFTFDVDPKSNYVGGYLQSTNSTFEYTTGSGSHAGVLAFDGGQDWINLTRFYDDNNRILTDAVLGGEMSFEAWACWNELRSWSRIFDFGGPAGSNDNNIYLGNQGTASTLIFNSYVGSSSASITSASAITLYNWLHIVATIAINPAANTTASPSTGAILSLYINGVRVQRGTSYLPTVMRRPMSWLGKSNWADSLFRGLMDDVFVYNYTLSAEAIAAHYVVPRIAVYELTFGADPRINMNIVGNPLATYSWMLNDTTDSAANQAAHSGLLVLSTGSTPSQYLDVSSENGYSQVGADLPVIGGAGWINANNFSLGWSFEVTFKLITVASGVCIFDFGNPSTTAGAAANDRVALCVSGTSLTFEVSNSVAGTRVAITVLATVAANTWYHVVALVQPTPGSTTVARYETFVNGQFATSLAAGVWLRSVARSAAYIGRSSVSTAPYLNGVIDSIRVYDYAQSPADVRGLYNAVSGIATSVTATPLYTTGPSVSHTFDVSVPWSERNGGTSLGWTETFVGRAGIVLQTQSSSQYLNLLTLPDRNFKLFPGFFGARSFSFEFWIYWNTFAAFQRVLEIGGEPTASGSTTYLDDIVIVTSEQTNASLPTQVQFSLNGGTGGTTNTALNVPNLVYLNRWYHLVCTVDVDRNMTVTAAGAATLNMYLNGRLVGSISATGPRYANRNYAWLSRGRNTWNTYLGGYIDAFHYYDYEVELEQVRVHALVPRPPQFELVWAERPSEMPGVDWTVGFGWASNDTVYSTAAGQSNHQGLLQLTAASSHYLDLVAVNATNSMGTVMPTLGALSSSSSGLPGTVYEFPEWASQPDARSGMTIEMSFLYTSATRANGKLFSCGATTGGVDLIELGFAAGSRDLRFSVHNSDIATSTSATVISGAYYQLWYHVVIVMRASLVSGSRGAWQVYVNGVLANTFADSVFPYATLRDYCVVGRSVSGATDTYVDGFVDSFRVFDYALNATEVQQVYAVINQVADSATGVAPPAASSSAAPTASSAALAVSSAPTASSAALAVSSAAPTASSAALAVSSAATAATATGVTTPAAVSSSVATAATGVISSSVAGTTGAVASSSAQASNSPAASEGDSGSSSLSSGAIAGIVIGGVVAVLLVLFALMFLRRGRAAKSTGGNSQQSGVEMA